MVTQPFSQVCVLVYLLFTRNNYPNCIGNFEGRFFLIVMKKIKIMFGYICV